MAEATQTAPLKKEKTKITVEGEEVIEDSKEHLALSKEFDPYKRYVFELAAKIPPRELPIINARTNRAIEQQEYPPNRNMVYTSQIIWNGRRRMIRYYDGCDSIFFDKQPKEKEIVQMLIGQTRRREFIWGKMVIEGMDRMLLLYMSICSWNQESPFRTPRANVVFKSGENEKKAQEELTKLDESEKALSRAKEASFQKMKIHAAYLGLPLTDYDTGDEITEKELRLKYRRFAVENSDEFNKSYGNEKIELKFFIDKALEKGIISNKSNPNKATWGKNDSVICDISGLVSSDAISQKIFDFSQTEEGTEFVIQLKSIAKEF